MHHTSQRSAAVRPSFVYCFYYSRFGGPAQAVTLRISGNFVENPGVLFRLGRELVPSDNFQRDSVAIFTESPYNTNQDPAGPGRERSFSYGKNHSKKSIQHRNSGTGGQRAVQLLRRRPDTRKSSSSLPRAPIFSTVSAVKALPIPNPLSRPSPRPPRKLGNRKPKAVIKLKKGRADARPFFVYRGSFSGNQPSSLRTSRRARSSFV